MATQSETIGTRDRVRARRVVDVAETKHSSKTTEFYAMVAVIAGILIACWWVGRDEGAVDAFRAEQAWLYVSIVGSAYMISRGLAKSGSHDFDADRDDR